ncbi:MAG TPA: response regulator [Blastocatellia bacterium]|nr:response regulator [Blastocatellia bacterium]
MQNKILLVEDSEDAREALARLLELDDYTVVTADDGRNGLSVARAEHPDLIITDINMPHMSGIDMIKVLRKEEDFKEVPIVVITAYGRTVSTQAIEVGADSVMTKPVEYDELSDTVVKLLAAPGPGNCSHHPAS